jgi:two-component system NtrC family sensor kinase
MSRLEARPDVDRRSGLRVELLVSLSMVMLTATVSLGAVLVRTHEASARRLHPLTARALIEDVQSPIPLTANALPELRWWILRPDGSAAPRGHHELVPDEVSRDLALAAQAEERWILLAGAPWEPIRFAVPLEREGEVALAHLPAVVSPGFVLALLLSDIAVFTMLGGYLLRRRIVLPLERLASAAHAIRDGAMGVRAPVDGGRETAEVGAAFNEMTEALELRSADLEKAVVDLQQSNRSLREAREGLDRSGRLAAVGRLASGVAHEVGNPMGAILGFLDLAGRDTGLSEQSRAYIARAGKEGERVRGILRQLLDFSSPPRPERIPLDVAAICEETAELVRAQRRYASIVFDVERDPAAPCGLGDRNLLLQIVLNLLLNAGDALLEAGTPEPRVTLRLRAGVRHVRRGDGPGDASKRRHFDALECAVSDNGPGIPEEDRERIFDAFFTTKAPGEGTGLGLANAVRLVEELGGSLSLAPAEDSVGATFVLSLPVASDPDRSPDGPRRSRLTS